MPWPRFSPRQWFWSITIACFIWAYAGTRAYGSAAGSVMRNIQGVFVWPCQTVLIPGSWIVTNVQGAIAWGIQTLTATHQETRSLASLQEQVQQDELDLATRDGQIVELNRRIDELNGQRLSGFGPGDLVTANIYGAGAGAGSNTITIDKGTAERIAVDMPVIAAGSHIIGRVASTGRNASTVRLITDPRSRGIRAIIVRHVAGQTQVVAGQDCYVEGFGNGEVGCTTIPKDRANVQPGDIVELFDGEWPARLKYFTLGVITSVDTNPNQPLRFEIRARANINDIHRVDVLTR
jgi:cell shape-determining protein MreC